MKRDARFELRMTQDEMDELLKFVMPGRRSAFIRQAIKAAIKRKASAAAASRQAFIDVVSGPRRK